MEVFCDSRKSLWIQIQTHVLIEVEFRVRHAAVQIDWLDADLVLHLQDMTPINYIAPRATEPSVRKS